MMTLNRKGNPLRRWAWVAFMRKIRRKSVTRVVGSQTWRQWVGAIYLCWLICSLANGWIYFILSEKKVLPSLVLASYIVYFAIACDFYFDYWCCALIVMTRHIYSADPSDIKQFVKYSSWKKIIWRMCNTRQSKQCGFSIYIFDNSKSKSMVRLVRAEKMVLSGLVFARKIARMRILLNHPKVFIFDHSFFVFYFSCNVIGQRCETQDSDVERKTSTSISTQGSKSSVFKYFLSVFK